MKRAAHAGISLVELMLALLIGAEGGLSEEEVEQALSAGFSPLQLGPRILRTETAAIAALAVAQERFGDF